MQSSAFVYDVLDKFTHIILYRAATLAEAVAFEAKCYPLTTMVRRTPWTVLFYPVKEGGIRLGEVAERMKPKQRKQAAA